MVMRAMRGEGKTGGILKYFLFTLLGMAVGGLVLGSFSGGASVNGNDVARIKDKTISIQSFDRAFQRAVSKYKISTKQAYKLGLADEVLASEIRSYFLLNEAENIGLEISKKQLSKQIAQVIKPYSQEGENLQDTLENILRGQGMSEKDFIEEIKRDMSGEIISDIIAVGFSPVNDLLVNDLYLFQTQTRDIELIVFPDDKNSEIAPATEGQLRSLYDAVKDKKYRIPEYRDVKVAMFDEKNIDVEFSVSDGEIQSVYEKNTNNFKIGEQLVLSQIVTKEKKQADEIYSLVKQGKALKPAVISVMGNDAPYIENVKFETSMMLPDLMKPLEARKIGKIIAPVKTMLGYHIVKLEDVLQPSIRPFNEVKMAIKKDLIEEQKADYFYNLSAEFDDMLNDGMSLDEISKEINIRVTSIGFIDKNGENKEGKNILQMFSVRYEGEAAKIIFELDDQIPSSMQDFGGKLVAFEVISIKSPTFKPLEDVKVELEKQFKADILRSDNEVLMQKYLAELSTDGSSFQSIATENNAKIEKISDISISDNIPEPLNSNVLPVIFKTGYGEYETIRLKETSALLRITGYGFTPPLSIEYKEKVLNDIRLKVYKEAKEEAFIMYLHNLSKKHTATINQRLLERAYGGG